MKQIWHRYVDWECYQRGMWDRRTPDEEAEMLDRAIEFTGDHVRYGEAMLRVIAEWPVTCEHHLTDTNINRRAWVGHAAVCIELGIPEHVTRAAWGHLTVEKQTAANRKADKAIKTWEAGHEAVIRALINKLQFSMEFA